MNPIQARDRSHLQQLVREHIRVYGNECDLNHIDVCGVTDMSCLFQQSNFNGNISSWNVANVTNMSHMFEISFFNGDISQWNTSKVENLAWMFNNSQFTGDISCWNTSCVKDMYNLFSYSMFKGDISAWDLSSLTSYAGMRAFHEFHDSPLGYLGVLKGEYDLPKNVGWAAHFYHLRSLCDGLNMDELSAAQFIYQRIALGFSQGMTLCHDTLPTNMDFSCKEG